MIHEKSNFPKPGDMRKEVYDTNNSGTVDNAELVNGHTVESDVPDGAVFTDTTYTEATGEKAGLLSASDKTKLDSLEFDEEITENSGKLVTSGAVYAALSSKQDTLTVDEEPTEDSANMLSSGAVFNALSGKQDMMTVDGAPTEGSTNPVASGGVYTALAGKQDMLTVDGAPTEGSTNPVASGGVYTALAGKQDRIQSASVIRVYLNGQEMDIASALNAIVGLTGTEQNVVFSCDQTSE